MDQGMDSDEASTNLFRKQFDLAGTEEQRHQMSLLAQAAGRNLEGRSTVLRPVVLIQRQEEITEEENTRSFTFTYDNQFDVYITKTMAICTSPVLRDDAQPSLIFNQQISPLDYFDGIIRLSGTELVTESPTNLSMLAGTAAEPYYWDILPFIPKRVVLSVRVTTRPELLSASSLTMAMFGMRFDLV